MLISCKSFTLLHIIRISAPNKSKKKLRGTTRQQRISNTENTSNEMLANYRRVHVLVLNNKIERHNMHKKQHYWAYM